MFTVYYFIVSQFQISDNNKQFIIHPAMQSACELNNIYLIAIKWMKLIVVVPFFFVN